MRAFFEAYKGKAKLVALEAARMAGYTNPRGAAQMLKVRFPERFETAHREYAEQFKLTDDELDKLVTDIAKNVEHRDQLKAIELIARMKGKFNDKVTINLTRKDAQRELEEVLSSLRAVALAESRQHQGQESSQDPQSKVVTPEVSH